MDYLVDTHAIIWFITNDPRLPEKIRKIIESTDNRCIVSLVSFWEIGIKFSLKKLELTADLETIFKIIEQSGFEVLPVTQSHIVAASKLEFHHRDPFDRLLIGQSITEKLVLISKDDEFKKYELSILW